VTTRRAIFAKPHSGIRKNSQVAEHENSFSSKLAIDPGKENGILNKAQFAPTGPTSPWPPPQSAPRFP
jgi:hypothetical protein